MSYAFLRRGIVVVLLLAGCTPRTSATSASDPVVPSAPSAIVDQPDRLNPAVVDSTIAEPHNHRRLERCITEADRRGVLPRQVRVLVVFGIANDGSVKSAEIKQSTTHDQPFESCVLAVFSSMTFPKPTGGEVMVGVPLTFKGRA
jgi:outer membrane biosynthesis protein TonB